MFWSAISGLSWSMWSTEAALLHVALNARDAMPEGGVLVIETANIAPGTRSCQPKSPVTTVFSCRCATQVPGDPEVVERALEPFFTTKDIGKGTGFGLSMVSASCASRGAQSASQSPSAKELLCRSTCRER